MQVVEKYQGAVASPEVRYEEAIPSTARMKTGTGILVLF